MALPPPFTAWGGQGASRARAGLACATTLSPPCRPPQANPGAGPGSGEGEPGSYRLRVLKALVQRYIETARREFEESRRKG